MADKLKKISALSIIVMLVGGTIGAGIFYKNKELLELSQGKFGIVLATWGVGIVGMMAIGLALIEITSAQKSDRGVLEWTRLFTPKWFHKTSSNFTKWFFLPIMFFGVPIYVTQSLEEVGVPISGPWMALFISVVIFLWFMITNLISLKFSEISQWVFTFVQTIPLIILPIMGFLHWGEVDGGTIMAKSISAPKGLNGASPYLAFVAGIGSIAFAYNGFYAASSLRNSMEKPSKLGSAQFIGISLVSLIYLFVSFGFNVAGDGTHEGLTKFINKDVFKCLRVCIVVGIVAIINNLAMASPNQLGSLIESGDAFEVKWIQRKIFRDRYQANATRQKYIAGWTFITVITLIFFVLLGIVGAGLYSGKTVQGKVPPKGNDLYDFASTIMNFTALFIFAIIVTTIFGALKNRKTSEVQVEKNKWFIPAAIVAIIINYAGLGYQFIVDFVNVSGYNGAVITTAVINLSIYFGVIFVSAVPAIVATRREKNINT